MAKALLLLSGGLDSTLAGKMLLDLGCAVSAVNFTSPFCRCTPKNFAAGCSAAASAAQKLGLPIKVFAKGEDYLAVVKKPPHGWGSGVNPCIDCRIFTFKRAKEEMEKTGADFIATGEVLGQRPMSQKRHPLLLIEREAGLSGKIVRPLSAQLLPPSDAEKSGVIDREKLLAISGRSRQTQIALADEWSIADYPCPAGGCLLTDQEFAARFRELLSATPDFDLNDARLLSLGRQFRLPSGAKAVVGRNEDECGRLEKIRRPASDARGGDWVGNFTDISAPTVLLRDGREEDLPLAAGLGLYHSKAETGNFVAAGDGGKEITVAPRRVSEEEVERWRIQRTINN
ncbi:hypothetical protein AGMMS49959_12370 [Planctomycetales bacterium]|nr:hypothetical protein AGMMS49959_12370 [Planctomycetales bacterium]